MMIGIGDDQEQAMTADILLGKKIGNYVLSSVIQEGGMGIVCIAEHPEIGRRVAVKIISRAIGEVAGMAERFIAEARALTRIEHPNIVDIYDFGRTDSGQLYYIMELLSGRELAAVMIAHGPMKAQDILPYLRQICGALQAAHSAGIVHRDLKPENVFVLDRQPLTIKLIDFGIAKRVGAAIGGLGETGAACRTATGIVMGTPYTIAPEQAAAKPEAIGPHTDIYSLGVVLYWMLAGHPPFTDEATAIILAKHIQDTPPALSTIEPSVPPAISALIAQCMQKNPKDRPASINALLEAFECALNASAEVSAISDRSGSSDSALAAAYQPTIQASENKASFASDDQTQTTPTSPAGNNAASGRTILDSRTLIGIGESGPEHSTRGKQNDQSRRVLWSILGVIGFVLAGGTAWRVTQRTDPPGTNTRTKVRAKKRRIRRHSKKPTRQHQVSAPKATTPALSDANIDKTTTRIIRVETTNKEITCHFWVAGVDIGAQAAPCRLHVSIGEHLRLEARLEKATPFLKAWTVRDNTTINLNLSPDREQIIETPARATAAHSAILRKSANRKKEAPAPRRPPRRKSKRSQPDKTPPTPPASSPPSKPANRLGDETVPF